MPLRRGGTQVPQVGAGRSMAHIDARLASSQVVVNMEEIRGNSERLTVGENPDAASSQRRNDLTRKMAFIVRYERPGCEGDCKKDESLSGGR